jgi:hypothetical protein
MLASFTRHQYSMLSAIRINEGSLSDTQPNYSALVHQAEILLVEIHHLALRCGSIKAFRRAVSRG